MTPVSITPTKWNLISERINDGRCVPFLGAGVNAKHGTDYQGLPLGADVALKVALSLLGLTEKDLKDEHGYPRDLISVLAHEKLKDPPYYKDLTRIGLYNLARVSLHLEREGDIDHFLGLLRSFIPYEQCEPSKLLKTLASLPIRLIITTNYDDLMERSLDAAGRRWIPLVQRVEGFDETEQKRQEQDLAAFWSLRQEDSLPPLVLYKIHGTFERNAPGREDVSTSEGVERKVGSGSGLIITEEDYIKFLTVVGISGRGVPRQIESKIMTSTLLFLGYGLEDWDFRALFKGLVERLDPSHKRLSFAIQKEPPHFWNEYWKEKKVEIYDMDLFDFATELEQKYDDYRKSKAMSPQGPGE